MAGIGSASAGRVTRGAAEMRAGRKRGATAAVLLVAMFGLSACSIPEWADPTEWFGDDEPAPVASAPASEGEAARRDATSERFPNLGRVPPRPVEVSSEGERRKAVETLAADQANARHTDEELRARSADAATPPPAPRKPVTQLPSAARSTAGQPAQPQSNPARPAQPAEQPVTLQPPGPTAPMAARNGAAGHNVTDTFAQSLAQSSATKLPPGLAQSAMQPGGMAAAGQPALPGSRLLLAVVRFGNGETSLDSEDSALIRRVAEYYKGTAGGKGSLEVVGYASSRTGNMDPAAHRQLNYNLSQRRAEAVAAALRRRGVAAGNLRASAQSDAAPVYYEAMPRAEDYNRRVEIYLVN